MPLPDAIVEEIIDRICAEALHRPDLRFTEREEIEAVVRLTLLQLEKWDVLNEKAVANLKAVSVKEESK